MALPSNLQTVTVTGKYVDFQGNPKTGSVIFTSDVVLNDPSQSVMVVPVAKEVVLDNTGAFTVTLPATNDPDVSPIGFVYHVKETFAGGRAYDVEFPYTTVTYDLSAVAPAQSITQVATFILAATRGIPNGVASLDSGGRVPAAQLPAAGGAIPLTDKGAAGGVATLGSDGKVPTGQLPAGTGGTTTNINGPVVISQNLDGTWPSRLSVSGGSDRTKVIFWKGNLPGPAISSGTADAVLNLDIMFLIGTP